MLYLFFFKRFLKGLIYFMFFKELNNSFLIVERMNIMGIMLVRELIFKDFLVLIVLVMNFCF